MLTSARMRTINRAPSESEECLASGGEMELCGGGRECAIWGELELWGGGLGAGTGSRRAARLIGPRVGEVEGRRLDESAEKGFPRRLGESSGGCTG